MRPGPAPALIFAAAVSLAVGLATSASAQTSSQAPGQTSGPSQAPATTGAVATGAGRTDELSEAARIDSYLADAARTPSAASAERRVTTSEAAASATAFPPMAPDSPWSRGVTGPSDGPSSLAAADAREARPCDHKLHGEVGAEIGTGGTRGGYGVVTAPVGESCWGQVTVGVSSYRGRGYGGYGGYGGYDYGGGLNVRGRDQTAFSLGFSASSDDARGPGRGAEYGGPGWGPPAY